MFFLITRIIKVSYKERISYSLVVIKFSQIHLPDYLVGFLLLHECIMISHAWMLLPSLLAAQRWKQICMHHLTTHMKLHLEQTFPFWPLLGLFSWIFHCFIRRIHTNYFLCAHFFFLIFQTLWCCIVCKVAHGVVKNLQSFVCC